MAEIVAAEDAITDARADSLTAVEFAEDASVAVSQLNTAAEVNVHDNCRF